MRHFGFLLILLLVLSSAAQNAQARKSDSATSGLFDWMWGDEKIWEGYDFEPYLGDQPIKNRNIWDNDQWTPEKWAGDEAQARRVIMGLYQAGILTNQYRDGNIPVLEVGEPYLRLSNTDRLRVLRFIDSVFEITKEKDGMFYVYLKDVESEPVGTFNKRGFQHY